MRGVTYLFFFFLATIVSLAQTSIYNHGTSINIQPGATLYVSGDYVPAGNGVSDNARVNGTFILHGDIINNSGSKIFLDEGTPGNIVFAGATDQKIDKGIGTGTTTVYLPSIFMEKTDGDLLLDMDIRVDSTIMFSDGFFGLVHAMGHAITMETNGLIDNERAGSRLSLDSGYLMIEVPTLNGLQAARDSTEGFLMSNMYGLGFGTGVNEVVKGEDNVVGVQIFRNDQFKSETQVANGISASRYYRMEYFEPAVGSLDSLIYHYFDEDVTGLPTLPNLALYVSNDDGGSWLKLDGTFYSGSVSDSVVVVDVPIVGKDGNPSAANWFALAEAICDTDFMPNNTEAIISTSHSINKDSPVFEINACEGEGFTLTYSNSNVYSWWKGGTLISENQDLSVADLEATDAGLYSIQLRNTKGCEISRDIQVNVWGPPPVDFNFTGGNICTGETVFFTNATSNIEGDIVSYVWDFGDGGNDSEMENPEYTYLQPDVYTVTLEVVSEFGCISSVQKDVTIQPLSHAEFTIREDKDQPEITQICSGEVIFFDPDQSVFIENLLGNKEISVLTWDFGDGQTTIFDPSDAPIPTLADTSTFAEVYHSYDVTTDQTFIVELTSTTRFGCITSISYPISVMAKPDASFLMQIDDLDITEGCTDSQIQFISTASLSDESAYEYLWSFGDGSISSEARPLKSYSSASTYQIDLTVTTKTTGCSFSSQSNLLINASPVMPFGSAVTSCGSSITLDALNSGSDYIWSDPVSGVIFSTDQLYTLSTASEDPTELLLEITNALGCTASQVIEVSLNSELIVDLGLDSSVCQEITLGTNEFPAASFLWSTGETTHTIQVTTSGTYSVQITESEYGCETLDEVTIEVIQLPEIDLGTDMELCTDETVILFAGEHAGYVWSDGTTDQELVVGSTGFYWVDVSNAFGCSSRDSVYVEVRDEQRLDLPDEIELCGSDGFELDAGIDGVQYEWSSSNGFISTERIVTIEEIGTYWLTVENDLGCVQSDSTILLETTNQLAASFLIPSIVGVGDFVNIVQLTDPIPETTLWSFGDGVFSERVNPIHQYTEVGDYIITLTISNGNCSDTISKEISVVDSRFAVNGEDTKQQLLEILELNIYPNPIIDIVKLKIELSKESPIEMRIFNLSGRQVFRNDYDVMDEEIQIDFSDNQAGLYLLHVRIGSKNRMIKIVKL
ncbi:MAG: PKD domain-containing protein [Cytophagales bacterium]|nr:PKD domain-containing protein [Cytophagales bacterium]